MHAPYLAWNSTHSIWCGPTQPMTCSSFMRHSLFFLNSLVLCPDDFPKSRTLLSFEPSHSSYVGFCMVKCPPTINSKRDVASLSPCAVFALKMLKLWSISSSAARLWLFSEMGSLTCWDVPWIGRPFTLFWFSFIGDVMPNSRQWDLLLSFLLLLVSSIVGIVFTSMILRQPFSKLNLLFLFSQVSLASNLDTGCMGSSIEVFSVLKAFNV